MTKFSELRKSFEGAVATGLMTTDEVNEKLAKAFAAGTAENDEATAETDEPATTITKAIDAAADEWMAKAGAKSDDDGDEGMDYEGSGDDDEDDEDHSEGEPEDDQGEASDDEPEDMSKGFGLNPEDAAAILAKAVGAEVATQNESLHVVLRKALGKIAKLEDRLEKVGNMAYAMSVNTKMAKAQVAPTPVTTIDPDVTVRLDRIEKATTERLERIEKAIKAPVGTFRGIQSVTDYEAVPAPGDENDPNRQMAKGLSANYVSDKLIEMQKAAKSNRDNTLETQINKDIGLLSIFPFQAAEYAAKYGIQ